jgi:hypothetical protein
MSQSQHFRVHSSPANISRKVLTKAALERDEELCNVWEAVMSGGTVVERLR